MKKIKKEIKEGVNLHIINTDKFKTNIVAVYLTTQLNRENVTKNALIPAILRRGNEIVKTQEEISKNLENLYGASFNCGVEKRGDNHILKFYIESLNNDFALEQEDIFNQTVDLLLNIVFNPLIEDSGFKEDYTIGEKENLKRIIEGKIDNKNKYAYIRCIEEMYKNKEYGLFEYGYIEDLKGIDSKNLYNYYQKLIQNCKIDVFVSGNFKDEKKIKNTIKENKNIKNLEERTAKYITDSKEYVTSENINKIEEKMDVTQGKLIIGLNVDNKEDETSALNIYNVILGGGSNSKLFQNVREKAELAYTAGSSYIKTKNSIFIRCGIEINNYEKTVEIIKQQLKDIEIGNFTDENIKNAKELLLASIKGIPDEQGNEISYYMSQELMKEKDTIEEYMEKINSVTKGDIEKVANTVSINTIYFLRN